MAELSEGHGGTPVLAPPGAVLDIARRLEEAGHDTWCVGGAVRDALLGHPDQDWDLATSARPEEVRRLFRRTVPVGIEHGTIGVLDPNGVMHEVTTFRRDVETDGRHARVEFSDTIDEDLSRRDFTINAVAWHPSRKVLHDPFGGRADLEARIVRAVGDPMARMEEDRLRALRAIRFAGRFGFEIEPATWRAIAVSAPHLTRLSPERVKQELEKTMDQVARPSRAIRLWKESGALAVLVPPLASISPLVIHALDYLAKPGLAGRPQRRLNRLAMLFLNHGGRETAHALRALRFSNQDTSWIATLVDAWEGAGTGIERALADGTPIDEAQIRRWAAVIGRLRVGSLMRLGAAIWAAKCEVGLLHDRGRRVHSIHRRMLAAAWHGPIETGDLVIDGDDLRVAGVAPGPLVGKILQALLDLVIEEPARNTREALLALVPEVRRRLESSTEG